MPFFEGFFLVRNSDGDQGLVDESDLLRGDSRLHVLQRNRKGICFPFRYLKFRWNIYVYVKIGHSNALHLNSIYGVKIVRNIPDFRFILFLYIVYLLYLLIGPNIIVYLGMIMITSSSTEQ